MKIYLQIKMGQATPRNTVCYHYRRTGYYRMFTSRNKFRLQSFFETQTGRSWNDEIKTEEQRTNMEEIIQIAAEEFNQSPVPSNEKSDFYNKKRRNW